jgi:DNA (cytosine-5)-methyltransferase 1
LGKIMAKLKYGSVCSGVEAATVAWHDLGFEPQWFSEVDAFPSAVLQHHYPNVPNHGDMTKFKEWNNDKTIDLLVGGTPCQSFSVAGLRQGLSDPRGNLMLTYLAMAEQLKPKWLVWENVPGVLSSNGGRDFATFITALGKIGYGFSWRVLDAQFFGVPQRRRRVFVVGCLGDWRSAASVLFESESLSGHPAPSRETRQRVAPTVGTGPPYSRTGNARVEADALVAKCLTTRTGQAYDADFETFVTNKPTVRRMTPRECERLQGFPDDYTQISWRGKEPEDCPNGHRYKAMGNSMAVPVMKWIGERIQQVEIASLREALGEVIKVIDPTESPFRAIPNPLMKEHADPIDIMIENKSGSLNIDLLNKDHEMKQKIKQKHMMGILLHRHPCTSAQMAEKLAMHVDEARPLLEKLFKGGQIAVAKVYDKPSQKRASYRLWAAKSNDFKPAEVEQSL